MAWLYSGPHVRVALPFPNALIAPTLTILRAPVDAVAEVGGNVHAGQPVLVIAETGEQWLSFNVREDRLHDLAKGGDGRRRATGRTRIGPGRRYRACSAGLVRDLACRTRWRRSP